MRKDKGVYRTRALDLDVANVSASTKLSIADILRNEDMLYVPPKTIAGFEKFMIRVNNIIVPVVDLERAIISFPDVWSVIKAGITTGSDGTGTVVPS